ncbi:MAG: PKD domain-containing protein [Bacteroidetes bacterium]|nr:PKD domain-containing protein [Bacteroidota bacterium]
MNGNFDALLLRTNMMGDLMWSKTFGSVGNDDCTSLIIHSDSGFVMIGKTDSLGFGNGDIYLIRTDSLGDTIQTKTFGGSGVETGRHIEVAVDGGLVISGSSSSFTGTPFVYMIKTDKELNAGTCNVHSAATQVSSPAIVEDTAATVVASIPTLINNPTGILLSTIIVSAILTPLPNFAADPVDGVVPLTVSFSDSSLTTTQSSWLWDFGDGDTSLQQHVSHQYDTVKTYTVRLTVTDSFGCSNSLTREDLINVRNPLMSGAIFKGDTSQVIENGMAYLYRYHTDPRPMVLVDSSTIDSNGLYQFFDVAVDTYILLAKPETVIKDVFEGYYPGEIKWEDAGTIVVNTDMLGVDITLKELPMLTGNGIIKGKLFQGTFTGKVMGPGDPLNGDDVLLVYKGTSDPVDISTTQGTGDFEFTNLPDDTYEIYVNFAGIPIENGVKNSFTITPAENLIEGIEITVDSNLIRILTTFVEELESNELKNIDFDIYPNPFSHQANITFRMPVKGMAKLEIYNLLGARVMIIEDSELAAGSYQYILNGNNLNDDVYLVRFSFGEKTISRKLVLIN